MRAWIKDSDRAMTNYVQAVEQNALDTRTFKLTDNKDQQIQLTALSLFLTKQSKAANTLNLAPCKNLLGSAS